MQDQEVLKRMYPIQDDIWPSRRWNKERTDYIDLSGHESYIDLVNATEFKVLVYGDMFVDEAMLRKGIYTANKPILHKLDETIESMVKFAWELENQYSFDLGNYIANLNKCKLIKVQLKFEKNEGK